ncbi:MAG: hypothetical protein ACKO34_08820 [Vampirovibrionales bacterium]
MLNFVQNQLFPQVKEKTPPSSPPASRPLTPSLGSDSLQAQGKLGQRNPFLISSDVSTANPTPNLHQNQPFSKPLFMGYYNNKPLYGATKLFILG